ncbi:Uncharacterised protein [Vibrio cholerae]|nr:Uncharacterised protein [Vibrio cholerae]
MIPALAAHLTLRAPSKRWKKPEPRRCTWKIRWRKNAVVIVRIKRLLASKRWWIASKPQWMRASILSL